MENSYSQQFLDDLIKTPKKILEPSKKEMRLENKHYRNEFKCESQNGEFLFNVFLRQSVDFSENFSIGLRYLPKDDESVILCRFNGPHGGWKDSPHHWKPHIHLAKRENMEKGLSSESYVEITSRYTTFYDAVPTFMEYCCIIDWRSYFPDFAQIPMDFKKFGDEND